MSDRQRKHQSGFTLLEIMVVVVILAILGAIVAPQILSRPNEARIVKAQQDIKSIEAALDLYHLDNGVHPSTDQGLQALITKPSTEPVPLRWNFDGYLKKLPKDPWGRSYQYRNPGLYGRIDIFTYGADGQEGGEGINAEIGNWQLD